MSLNAEIILALLAVLTALGGGIKYVLSRIDAERVRADAAQQAYKLDLETSRTRYETLVQSQIAELRAEIALQDRKLDTQNRYIDYLNRVADAHRRHILVLEGLMRDAGITIPTLHLPERPMVDGEAPAAIEVVKPRRRRKGASA